MVSLPTPKLAYTVAEACQATGLSKSTIYNLIRDGSLAKRKVRGRTLISADELQGLVRPPEQGQAHEH